MFTLGASGCSKGGSASKDDLALVPKETQMVFGMNFSRMRGTAMWKKLVDFGMSNDKSKKDYEEFAANCVDLNTSAGPESAFIALPSGSGGMKDFEAIIRLKDAVDEAKAAKCITFMASKNGDTITTTDYNGKKLYTSSKGDKTSAALLDSKTVVSGSDAWVRKTIDIVAGKDPASAKTNDELTAVVKQAKTSEAFWGAAIVPQSARDSFKNDPKLAPMASLKAVVGMMDFAKGLDVDVDMDTGSEADAKAINTQVQTQLGDLKKSPQVMMLGVSSWIDGIKTDSKGPTFHVALNYTQPQVDEMVARIQGLVRSFGAGMGGMGGPPPGMGAPMGGPPPGMGGNPGMAPSLGAPALAPPALPPGGAAPAAPVQPAAPTTPSPAH